MDRRHLQSVWKLATDAGPPAPDAELLRRFARDRDDDAFAELVRRHGRLVWALCRNLLPCEADADDAFQATFLVLARSAGSVRDAARLGPWLHGVAYRVCLKARRAAARRKRYERAAAAAEAGRPVADAAWDAALAAVHEEVARLPDALRVAFVTCCLEGKGATEAAGQLGWKLGTLSGRLTRAKQTLLARLADRGISAAVVASAAVAGGAASAGVPAAVIRRTAEVALAADAVPKSVLTLTQGVTGMAIHRTKLLAAAVLVAGGLATGVGSGWLATADAQQPTNPIGPANPSKPAEPPAATAGTPDADLYLRLAGHLRQSGESGPGGAAASKWEYDFVLASEMGTTKFVAFLRDREARGWEFNGQVTLQHLGKDAPHWLFRRPTPQARSDYHAHDAWAKTFHQHLDAASCVKCHHSSNEGMYRRMLLDVYDTVPPKPAAAAPANPAALPDPPAAPDPQVRTPEMLAQAAAAAEREHTLRAEVQALQQELERLRGTPKSVTLPKASLGLSPRDMQQVLAALAADRFGTDGKKPLTLEASDSELTLRGSAEVVDWAAEMAKKLSRRDK